MEIIRTYTLEVSDMKLKPISVIKADLGINPGGKVQAFFTETCKKHMEKYVPYSRR